MRFFSYLLFAISLSQVGFSEQLGTFNSIVQKSIEATLRNEKVVLFGETHLSSASFDSVGITFLDVLKDRGFNCLIAEMSRNQFQPSYTAFNKGLSFNNSVAVAYSNLQNDKGVLISKETNKNLFEAAKTLGYKLFAMDADFDVQSVSAFYIRNSELAYEQYLKHENNRNKIMSSVIIERIASGDCDRVIVVTGTLHITLVPPRPYRQIAFATLPEYLRQAGASNISYRLLPEVKKQEKISDAYSAVFIY